MLWFTREFSDSMAAARAIVSCSIGEKGIEIHTKSESLNMPLDRLATAERRYRRSVPKRGLGSPLILRKDAGLLGGSPGGSPTRQMEDVAIGSTRGAATPKNGTNGQARAIPLPGMGHPLSFPLLLFRSTRSRERRARALALEGQESLVSDVSPAQSFPDAISDRLEGR